MERVCHDTDNVRVHAQTPHTRSIVARFQTINPAIDQRPPPSTPHYTLSVSRAATTASRHGRVCMHSECVDPNGSKFEHGWNPNGRHRRATAAGGGGHGKPPPPAGNGRGHLAELEAGTPPSHNGSQFIVCITVQRGIKTREKVSQQWQNGCIKPERTIVCIGG
jgi:hypothetical protein